MGERGPRPASRRVTLVLRRYRVIEEPVYGSWEAHESGCGARWLSGSHVRPAKGRHSFLKIALVFPNQLM